MYMSTQRAHMRHSQHVRKYAVISTELLTRYYPISHARESANCAMFCRRRPCIDRCIAEQSASFRKIQHLCPFEHFRVEISINRFA